jgi:chromosome partitioning protein
VRAGSVVPRAAPPLREHLAVSSASPARCGDRQGKAAREVAEALEGTDLPVLETRIPLSRRVPSATLDKRPVVLAAPSSSVAQAYVALADELLASYSRKVTS